MASIPAIKLEDGKREEVDAVDYLTRDDADVRPVGRIIYVVINKDEAE